MFMIYECNVCACKPICCIAKENKSLTVVGENKSLTAEDCESNAKYFLRNPENFNDFYWGLLTGVFVLSRSNKNSAGKRFIL